MVSKEYYQIGEICEIAGLSHSTVRFWESKISGLKASRSSGGHRIYSREQLELVLYLKKLLYDEKYTIDGAKKRISQEKSAKKNGSVTGQEIAGSELCVKMESAPTKPDMMFIKKELEEILFILKNN